MFEAKIPPQYREYPREAMNAFKSNGYHIECGIWSNEECDAIISAAEAYKITLAQPPLILEQMHKSQDIFLSAMRKPDVVHVIEGIFEAEGSGIQSGFFFCPPNTRGFSLHQDNIYVDARPETFVLAWTALCDVSPNNGCLYLYPGTHREPILPLTAIDGVTRPGAEPGAYDGESIVPNKYEPRAVVIPQGSTVFLHGHTVHGSHDNHSKDFRFAMFNSYVRRGSFFRRGNRVKRKEVKLHEQYS